jgi:O-antigen/teichoic acid export membrane protein
VTVVILAASILLFVAIWFALPQYSHYLALATIGIVSLIFALVTSLGRAFTRDGGSFKSLSWGYAGLGFALLVGSVVLAGSASILGVVLELTLLVIVVVVIGIVAGLAAWGSGSARMAQQREMQREAWRASTPPSAFDYTTARPNIPGAPATAPTSDDSTPATPPGARQ